jgi:glycosyltransferase involved in cell wall biosynthesis
MGVSSYVGCGTVLTNPLTKGFGEEKLPKYLEVVKPDIVLFYDDIGAVSFLTSNCLPKKRKFKIWVYLDQNFKHGYTDGIVADHFFIFSEQWRMPIEAPQTVLLHAPSEWVVPISDTDKAIFREELLVKPNRPVFLCMNRNSERKRLDLLIQAFTMYINTGNEGHLVIHTKRDGYYNLGMVCKLENAPIDYITITDGDVEDSVINNILNIADYGVNTSDGEGFGLMALEMAKLGKPQIAMDIGSHRSFLNDNTAVLLKPTIIRHRNYDDRCGAITESTSVEAFAQAFKDVQAKDRPEVDITWELALEGFKSLLPRN